MVIAQTSRVTAELSVAAALFDLDGVLVPTSELHRKAWSQVMSSVFEQHRADTPYSEADYYELIDGRPRFEGVSAALQSRGIWLEWGRVDDAPGTPTVCGIGNQKNAVFEQLWASGELKEFPETKAVLRQLQSGGIAMAVVSSSRNATPVLQSVGILDFFSTVVDGGVAEAQNLPGKPDPATFRYAAAALGVPTANAVVVEDATFGVAAGRAGGFGLVVGIDRGAGEAALLAAGADLVLPDLGALRSCWTSKDGRK